MGNCPSEFMVSPVGFGACVIPCPAQKNYELRVGDKGVLSCVYTGDTSISVPVLPVPAVQKQGPPFSYKELPNASVYQTEIDRFSAAFAVADANVSKVVKIKTAYDALQLAENARDQSPDAYQQARIGYYTLVKGDKWIEEERQRIANVEAQPVINNFLAKRDDLNGRIEQQKSTIEVVNGVKDKVLSVEDDLQYSVSAFQKQIGNVRNQMNMDKKKQIETAAQAGSWVDSLLNWLIALTTIIAIFFIARYIIRKRSAFSAPASPPLQR
jgi:hypothetical protein